MSTDLMKGWSFTLFIFKHTSNKYPTALELVITAVRFTRELLNEERCHSVRLLPGSLCHYKSWGFCHVLANWKQGHYTIENRHESDLFNCYLKHPKLASHSAAGRLPPGYQLLKQRESKYVYFFVSLCYLVRAVLHAATQCYLLFVSGERIWQVQYTVFIWQGKFFIPILRRKWNYLSTGWATSFLARLIMREGIAELYFLARSRRV